MNKRKLAVLGLGSRSTLFYIKQLNLLYNNKNGGYSTCPFILLNTDFDTINQFLPDTSKNLDSLLQYYISDLEKLDIESILIPNITLHETIDRLEVSKLILHPLHLTISEIKKNEWTRIVLFGSLHSMTSDYISSYLKFNAIQVILPTEDDMVFIDSVRKHIYNETETEDLIEKYYAVIEKYTSSNPVILACTELSIFKPNENKKLLDMSQLQVKEAINIS